MNSGEIVDVTQGELDELLQLAKASSGSSNKRAISGPHGVLEQIEP